MKYSQHLTQHENQVDTWDGPLNEPHHVVVNTEWGAFGDKGELDFILVSGFEKASKV